MEQLLYMHASLLACFLAYMLACWSEVDGANVVDGALGQVIKVTLLENPYS